MEREKRTKTAKILTDGVISTILFHIETRKEQNETQKHIAVFRRRESCLTKALEFQIKLHSRAMLKSYTCQDPNKGGTLKR